MNPIKIRKGAVRMKRTFAICMVLLCLLAGCTKPQAPIPPVVPPPDVPPDPPVDTRPTLLKEATPVGDLGNLWEVTFPFLEGMEYPQLLLFGKDVLLLETRFDQYGNGHAKLQRIDLDTGKAVAERTFDCEGSPRIKVSGQRIGICDSGRGWVKIVDSNLQDLLSYSQSSDWSDWIFSPDLSVLYQLHWNGIHKVVLATGETTKLADTRDTMLMDEYGDTALINYLDIQDQRVKNGTLDLNTGEVKPLGSPFEAGWMMQSSLGTIISDVNDPTRYHMLTDHSHVVVKDNGNSFRMDHETGHIFTLDMESRSPMLHDLRGKFVSRFDLPGGEWVQLAGDILWCEAWQGYLLTTARDNGPMRLLFWDPKVPVTGEDMTLLNLEGEHLPHTAEEQFYAWAERISQTYGVDVRIAEQCALDYSEFTATAVADSARITEALENLERALGAYPEGFFEQLLYNRIRSIRIELVTDLQRKDWPDDVTYTSFSAFAQEMGDHYLLVIDVTHGYPRTYYHEISHIIDRRLAFDAIYRPDALYSEEAWKQLQPEGFDYSYNYENPPENWTDYLDWFADDYSMTFPTEDRARIMEQAMDGWDWNFQYRPQLLDKLAYYSRCIRDCFDTTGWPEETLWEQMLSRFDDKLDVAA